MWISKDNKLIHTTDKRRQEMKVRVSSGVLNKIKELAEEYNTFPNYLIESGVIEMSKMNHIPFDKKKRPKDRKVYGTSFDTDVINTIRTLAKNNGLFIADIIELSVYYINVNTIKDKTHRYRTIREE